MNKNLYDEILTLPGTTNDILNEFQDHNKKGMLHVWYVNKLRKHGLSNNLIIPYWEEYTGKLTHLVVINNPEDAERILEKHVKKTPYLKKNLYDSIISTTDVENWRDQRKHFQPSFSVFEELEPLIPKSNERAKKSITLLENTIKNCDGEYVDIHEFFLNETMAQLQLAMFGFSEEFQEKTNVNVRKIFSGEKVDYAPEFISGFQDEIKTGSGPLSAAFRERSNVPKRESVGNALIFPFAGHDTTANTLSWLIYEVAQNKEVFQKLQNEVDTFWKEHPDDSEITYNDLKKLTFMTRCIMETLRLWTSIPNGTFRELIEDDYVIGKNGNKVSLPKGTYVQVPNWTRHRNPDLWGSDVDIFNPEREFKDEEFFFGKGMSAYNPCSERFSPFTYGPRDCIGKNFSQIEMRIILLQLLKHFSFIIPKSQSSTYTLDTLSFNSATLSPRNIFNKNLYETKTGMYVAIFPRDIKCNL